ncbi:Ankyrin repeat [Fusarium oxysporum f. sp. vasinfectum]|nr:Ankyrin repeat [Fusarium oxysporum f. sp. vasinfectum]
MKHPAVTSWLTTVASTPAMRTLGAKHFFTKQSQRTWSVFNASSTSALSQIPPTKPAGQFFTRPSVDLAILPSSSFFSIVEQKGDTKTHSGWSVLHTSVSAGQMEYVSLLIDRGADITCRSKLGWSPLDIAVHEATSPEIISLLLGKGADPHAQDIEGYTALCWAAENPRDFACRLLLEQGVKVDSVPLWGYESTPLTTAASMLHVGVVRILIEAGADPNIIGSFGQAALDFAANDPGSGTPCLVAGPIITFQLPNRYSKVA